MLTTHDNEMLTRVGPGTPMGSFIREFWMPFLPSRDLPERDGPLKRVRLLGEDLVRLPRLQRRCWPARRELPAPGRVAVSSAATRAAASPGNYHGWKYDVTGACLEMPNEPEESNFKDKVRATAYPVVEVNKALWTYMGPRETPAPLPKV